MSWRTIVIAGTAKLDYRLDYLVVRKVDGESRVHLSEIGLMMVESTSVSLTTTLLAELVKHKIKVIFCDEKHNPSSELIPYYGSHDTSAKIKNQIAWDQETKEAVWTEIVADKIRKQAEHLKAQSKDEEADLLRSYIKEMEFADKTMLKPNIIDHYGLS